MFCRTRLQLIKIHENWQQTELTGLETLQIWTSCSDGHTLVVTEERLTLTLMILLLKLFSTTTMSSDSAGESVPSWLRGAEADKIRTGSSLLKSVTQSKTVSSPVNLVDFIGASFPQLQDPGARVRLQLEVTLQSTFRRFRTGSRT